MGNGDMAPVIIIIHNSLLSSASGRDVLASWGKADDAHWLGHTHTHTHTHIYIYIYIFIFICVCVCFVRNVKIIHKK